jgi:hypothetical protein
METAISAPSTPRARSRLGTAAGITPVSLHQLIKMISCPGDHLQRDAGATVEQDEGHPYVEQELSANPVQGVRDEPEHGRLDKGVRSDQHDHLGEPYGRVYELETSPAPSMRPKSRRMWSICSNL